MAKPVSVLVAGANGMVGSAICRALKQAAIPFSSSVRADTDLTQRSSVDTLLSRHGYEWLIVAAAKVGGIHANDTFPAEFIFENLAIETNLIDSAYRHGVKKLIFLGSSCIYPVGAAQPMQESALLSGALEPTNEPYAIAKIAGIKLCESYNRQYGTDYRSLMPTNLYGPGDNYHPENSHVIPGLIRRFHSAKLASEREIVVWGSGRPRREFLHVDDLARAVVHVMSIDGEVFWAHRDPRCSHLNVGTGADMSISELAEMIREVVGLDAKIVYDTSKPDGAPRKLLDVRAIGDLGWNPSISLREGLKEAYDAYRVSIERPES